MAGKMANVLNFVLLLWLFPLKWRGDNLDVEPARVLPHWSLVVTFVETPIILNGPLEVKPTNLPATRGIFWRPVKCAVWHWLPDWWGGAACCCWRCCCWGFGILSKMGSDQRANEVNVVLFFIKHLTGGFIEQNSSCSEVSKWKSSRAT